jgi:KRAB domain-containing zinc finger protein
MFSITEDLSADVNSEDGQINSNEILNISSTNTIVLYRKDIPPPSLRNYKVNKKRPRIDKNCPICHKFFRFKIQYEDHILKHSDPKPYKCKICTASFRLRGQLKAHVEVHGTIGTQYQCSFCPKGFTVKSRLLMHEAKHTNRDRKFICDLCGKAFMEKHVLTMHKKHVHEKTYIKCHVCKKKISSYM